MNEADGTAASARRCAAEAVGLVRPGDALGIAYSHGQPPALIRALVDQKERFDPPVRIYTGAASVGVFDYADASAAGHFHTYLLHPGRLRRAVAEGRATYLPVDTLEFCRLLDEGLLHCDVAFAHVSPPDDEGNCSLGLTAGIAPALLRRAGRLVAQVNPRMPRTFGERVSVSRFETVVEAASPPLEWAGVGTAPSAIERRIADNVARLVAGGATLQVGIGSLADAVLQAVAGKRRLRLMSGLVSDAARHLAAVGALDDGCGPDDAPVRTTAAIGSSAFYTWCDRNPLLRVESSEALHAGAFAAPRFTAVNSALDVDLTGQVNVERLGGRVVGGVGGHLRFMLAASASPGGRAVLALPSTSRDGRVSRIRARLGDAPVATPRSAVHYVVTEHGIADLQGRTVPERVEALVAVAHPDVRSSLRREAAGLV